MFSNVGRRRLATLVAKRQRDVERRYFVIRYIRFSAVRNLAIRAPKESFAGGGQLS